MTGVVAVLLFSTSVAFAEGQATSASRATVAPAARALKAATTTESVRDRMQAARTSMQEKAKAEKEKVAKKLANVQDKKRQQEAQKVAAQFEKLNTTWTDHFTQLLARYNIIMQKMKARSAIATAKGKDMSVANAAIATAANAITVAQTAVIAQAAKTYVPDTSIIPTTTATSTAKGQEDIMRGLKASFQNLHTALFKDLFALRDGPMTAAKKAVQDALQALGKVPGVDEDNATTTAKSNQ